MNKYVLMVDKGIGYGDSVCLLSVVQGLHEREDCKVAVFSGHPECFEGQQGVDYLANPCSFDGFWEAHCKDATQIFRYFYWEINGRMRNIGGQLLNVFRQMSGLKSTKQFPNFVIKESDITFADELVCKCSKPLVLFHRGLGRESKLLSIDVCNSVIEELKKDFDVAQIGYDHDSELAGIIKLRGKLSFGQNAAVMSRALFMVGHDSLPAHMSGIVQTPGVFIYGPTSPNDFGYDHNENVVHEECPLFDQPCGRPAPWHFDYMVKGGKCVDWECPDRRCMLGVTVDDVMVAVKRLRARMEDPSGLVGKGIKFELR